ncbi:hypothetical protein FACS1894205_2800 [Alphaproteobacteria bacterium]|nr:hypothetical protein FACS1894205_2800 [Alphaproteobacteria bacterium]
MKTVIKYEFEAVWHEEASVWTVHSDEAHITTEAESEEDALKRLGVIVPDILESRGEVYDEIEISVTWLKPVRTDHVTLAA